MAWGGFSFRRDDPAGRWRVLADSELAEVDPRRTGSMGANAQPYGAAVIEVANAESRVDLVPLVGTEAAKAAYLYAPIVSPVAQEARLVLDTRADVRVWLDGRSLDLSTAGEDSGFV